MTDLEPYHAELRAAGLHHVNEFVLCVVLLPVMLSSITPRLTTELLTWKSVWLHHFMSAGRRAGCAPTQSGAPARTKEDETGRIGRSTPLANDRDDWARVQTSVNSLSSHYKANGIGFR
jgi:hypothetical protein